MGDKMKILLFVLVSFLVLQAGCKKETSTQPSATPSVINGGIRDAAYTGNPIRGATITVATGSIQPTAVSDTNGAFTLSFGNLTSDYDAYLIIRASGYADTTMMVTVKRGESQTILIYMRGVGGVIITNPDVKKASQVAYIGASATDIYITGVGALENSVITYEVRDSLGMAVAKSPRYGATFTSNFYPNVFVGGGTPPKVIPNKDSTDANGQLHVSVVSGSESGVVELLTKVTVDSVKTITSQPVRITVHAGFPDQNHFTLMPSRFVFPGMESYLEVPLTVAVGDTFSNPVPTGWAVYFHSQAGIMQTGFQDFQAYTDKRGLASASLETVNPKPNALPYCDTTFLSGLIGGEWLYAQTMGRDNKTIIDSVLVVWNQAPILIGLDGNVPSLDPFLDSAITMPAHGASRYVAMRVTDFNGNPLCDGTTITATISYPANSLNNLKFDVAGNIPATIPIAAYCRFPGPGVTDFRFCVMDNSQDYLVGTVTVVLIITAPGLETVTLKLPVTVY